jgi:glucose/mannose-6-phosphate isomerase
MPEATLSEADVAGRDRSGMAALIASWPAQIATQRAALAARPWPAMPAPTLLAVGGMGGSAIASDLVFTLAAGSLPFPTLVCRDYAWPAAVRPGALAVLSSYSGNTEETLALYEEAKARGVARLAITTGGELARRCEADGTPWRAVPAGLPPRAALGYSVVSLSLVLEALGDPGFGAAAWAEAHAVATELGSRCAPDRPEADNPAKSLARAVVGRAVCVYGGAGFAAPVARRWKGQLHENAKTLAFDAVVPEMNHNEIVGWQALADLHPRFAVILLRDRAESPALARRMAVTREILEDEGVGVHEVHSIGASPLARMVSLIVLGDWMSLYLAVLAGVDPTPIVKIDRLKAALASAGGDAPGNSEATPR